MKMKCPIYKTECIKGECEWFANVYDETCDIPAIAILLNEIHDAYGIGKSLEEVMGKVSP